MDFKFNVEFLDDAIAFLEKIPHKDREKILYNIWKSRAVNDPEFIKKYIAVRLKFGEYMKSLATSNFRAS